MKLMIANWIAWTMLLAGSAPVLAQAPDLKAIHSLKTQDGQSFENVEILEVDARGVMFRHGRGLAKLPFSDFEPAVQKQFYVAAVQPVEPAPGEIPPPPGPKAAPAPAAEQAPAPGWIIIHRWNPPAPVYPVYPVSHCSAWGIYSPSLSWPMGYALPYPLSLSQSPYRRRVELEFLLTTGILPSPCLQVLPPW